MKRPLKLLVSVTKDKKVHRILERVISKDRVVSRMFARRYVASRAELLRNIKSANVLFCFSVSDEAMAEARNLEWIHFASAGVEKSLRPSLFSRGLKITCSRGLHAGTIAEYVMMQMLAFSKNLRRAYDFQRQKKWSFSELLSGKFDLSEKTVGIVGLGSIGRRVARLASAFGMDVVGTVRKPRPARYVKKVYSPDQLDRCLAVSDFVVVCAPLTAETHHLIDRRRFRVMRKNALLINVSRGPLVDEDALVMALRRRWIAGAALDVFESEPLPGKSPLWRMDNVSVTPHYAGMAENIWEKVAALFCKNAVRFKKGQRLLGRVSRRKGY